MNMVIGATSKTGNSGKDRDASSKENKDGESGVNNSPADAPSTTPPSTLCSITVNSYKFVYLDHSPYTLVAQGNGEESEQFLGSYICDVRDLIQTYFGNGVVSPDDIGALKGIVDLIHHMLMKYAIDLSYLCSGTRWVYLDEEVREQVDRLLANLEENSVVTAASSATSGNTTGVGQPDITGTMLVLGNSILHSRIPNFTSRMVSAHRHLGAPAGMAALAFNNVPIVTCSHILLGSSILCSPVQLLHHLSCRPFGASKLRTLPLFFDGVWKHYVFLRLRHMTLVVAVNIKAPLSKLLNLCLEFEEDLVETNLNLPVEEPPVLLRHYTGHDTIAFLYHHLTGVTVAPPPRNTNAGGTQPTGSSTAASNLAASGIGAKAAEQLANQAEATKTLQVFNWFYSRAKSVAHACNQLARLLVRVAVLILLLIRCGRVRACAVNC
jgi:hypothetical protein